MRRIKKAKDEAELDITSFMNLMIVLVPVLLLNMVFSQTTVLEIKLPEAAQHAIENPKENQALELIARDDYLLVNFPAGVNQAKIDNVEGQYDYETLSKTLQNLKQWFADNGKADKKDIVILLQKDTSYQKLVTLMDTVRSYKAELMMDVVNAELFPDISLGDAPEIANAGGPQTIAGGVK
ncbi:MAG: biopolymer transporter ExbD [Cellvibrionales bacterium]|nr:biopolymer transporter ExbD [Cellvibrionales bacterium]